jgi:hypothetical protein
MKSTGLVIIPILPYREMVKRFEPLLLPPPANSPKMPYARLRESTGAPSAGRFQTQLDLNQSPGLHFLSGLAYDFFRLATKCREAMFVGAP